MIKKSIPNLISLLNLFSGLIALFFVFHQQWLWAGCFVLLGILFDFLDGMAARVFNATSKMGLELDSLADMVTSGVVPGFTLFFLLQDSLQTNFSQEITLKSLLPFAGLLVSLGSALRLAKFNIDERQTSSFIGLPTPANTLFIMSLPLIAYESTGNNLQSLILNPFFLITIFILSAYILNAKIQLFSLKFKHYAWQGNQEKYILIILSIFLLLFFNFLGIPLIILSYIFLSVIKNNKN